MKEKALKLLSYLLVAAVASAATFGAILWFWGGNSKLDELEYVIYDYYIEDVDFEAIEEIEIPAVIYGPIGKEYHQWTERVNKKSLLEVVPAVTQQLFEHLWKK